MTRLPQNLFTIKCQILDVFLLFLQVKLVFNIKIMVHLCKVSQSQPTTTLFLVYPCKKIVESVSPCSFMSTCALVSIVLFYYHSHLSLFCLGIICAQSYSIFGSILTLRNSQKWIIWDEVQSKSYPLPSSFYYIKQQLNKSRINNDSIIFKDLFSLAAFSAADQRPDPFIMCMQPCIVRQAKRVISELFFSSLYDFTKNIRTLCLLFIWKIHTSKPKGKSSFFFVKKISLKKIYSFYLYAWLDL